MSERTLHEQVEESHGFKFIRLKHAGRGGSVPTQSRRIGDCTMTKYITENDMLLETLLMLCRRTTRIMRDEGTRITVEDTIEADGEEWHVTAGSDPKSNCCVIIGHTHGKVKSPDGEEEPADPQSLETVLRQLGFIPATRDDKEFQFVIPVAWLDRIGDTS